MPRPSIHAAPRWAWALTSLLAASLAVAAPPVTYLQNDAHILGGDINTFPEGDQRAMVVTGHFSFEVGKKSVSGQKAVVWVTTQTDEKVTRNEITMYVEGDARVDDGTNTMADKFLLVRVRIQGRLTADADAVSSQSLVNLPLYRRAKAAREDEARVLAEFQAKMRARGRQDVPEPGLAVRTPATTGPGDASADKVDEMESVGLEAIGENAPTTQPKRRKPLSQVETGPKKLAPLAESPQLVQISAPKGATIEKDKDDGRIIIIQGEPGKPVVLSQGTSDKDNYLELRADRAVLFMQAAPDEDLEERAPYAAPLPGISGGGEKIVGVYLEGDIIIARGERKLSGQSAYYDFVAKKALVMEPVFRTVQEVRNIPIYIRADEARMLSQTEIQFRNAVVSTSDFKTPTYSLNAQDVTLRDKTPYDAEGEQLGERRYSTQYRNAWFDIRGMPVFYSPVGETEFEEGHTALRKVQAGRMGKLGWGAETEWHLFRLLGLVAPEGVKARVNANYYEMGALLGVDGEYQRQEENRQYSGYFRLDGVYDIKAEDTFGDEKKDIPAPHTRGRILARHKEFLPHGWELQAELALMCDKNYLREFYPDEYWTGKEQENLIYAKKQRDNWAITALLKARLNDFQTTTETFPELEGFLIGEPLAGGNLTYFGEMRTGFLRYRDSDAVDPSVRSDMMPRFDMRHEIDAPLAIQTPVGPINVVPYLTARLSYWGDTPTADQREALYNPNYGWFRQVWNQTGDGDRADRLRFYGQIGARANMTFHRIFPNVENRLLDIHGIRHIVTPELVAFGTLEAPVTNPTDLYPLTPEVEEHLWRNNGVSFALYQRWQTKRGEAGNRRVVDWMRLNITGAWFQYTDSDQTGIGKMFFTRPEYSYQRPYLNIDYAWNISDSVALMAEAFYDFGDGDCSRLDLGFSVQRDPRLSYYAGIRYVKDIDTAVGTFGVNYQINKKYSISAFEQYDFCYRDGVNLGTRVTIVRKFPRWYAGVTFAYDARYDGDDKITVLLSLWPEGVPEARIGGGRDALLNRSYEN